MNRLRQSFFVAIWALVTIASAGAADFTPNVTVLRDDVIYDVNADGTYVMDEKLEIRLNTDQAVKSRGQVPLSYSASLQDLQIVEAYTITKGGQRLEVEPDKVLVQQSPQSQAAPMFDDGKVKTVIFPGVEIGSTLTLHYRRAQKSATFPGQFSALEVVDSQEEIQSTRITVRAPASLHLDAEAVDMSGGRQPSDKPEVQRWEWFLENRPGRAAEIGSVSNADFSPRVAVTTFTSYEALGRAYLDRAAPKAAVTAGVQSLADQITHGIDDRRGQAEALYRWVSANIRYVAIFLDFGGVVPHDAQSILDAKYGDCKDHVVLLESLLAAKGIKSSPVLVNSSNTYWLPKVALAPGVFDHAITYLPEFDLYVDSTTALATFGTLTVTEQGKRALVTNDGSGQARVSMLPLANSEHDRVDVTMRLSLDAAGNLTGTGEIQNRGMFDWISRQIFASFPPGMESQVAARILTLTGQNGTGTYASGKPRNLETAFRYSTKFELPDYVQLPGPGAMVIPQGLGSFSGIPATFDLLAPERRELPMPFAGRRITETITVDLPPGMTSLSLPKPTNISSSFGTYVSTISRTGQTLLIQRRLDISMSEPLVEPADYQTFRAFAQDVKRSLKAQISY